VDLGLQTSNIALCLVQGALVAAPVDPRVRGRASVVGLVVPVAMLAIGVALLNTVADAPHALAILGWTATPVLAAGSGWLLAPLRLWITVPVAALLYLAAWQVPGHTGEAAAVALISLACLSLTAIVAAITPPRAIQLGLVILCVVDAVLVWGTPQVGPASNALANTPAPIVSPPVLPTRSLPSLQQVTFGSVEMGWIDLLAPALLCLTIARSRRLWPAIATAVAAIVWGLLLEVTSTIPATTPVLAGLAVALFLDRRHARDRRAATATPRPEPA
jgi:hypothetical protein